MSHTKKIHEKILFGGVKSFQKCKKNPITMQDLKQPQSIWILMERGLSHTNMSHTFFLKKSFFRAIKTGRNKRKRNSLGKLSSLVGAMKIHEVLIEDNLVVKKKNLPTDAFYKMVNIRESRRKVAAAGAKNDSDFEYDDIVDSDY